MQVYAIYVVTNMLNNKQYVGLTNNLKRRWSKHKNPSSGCSGLRKAISKHGVQSFVFEHIADAFSLADAREIEKELVRDKNTLVPFGYNLTLGGEGTEGHKHSQEARQKIGSASAARVLSQDTKRKISESNKGRKPSPLAIKNSIMARMGVPVSETTKQKLREANKGKKMSAEAIQKSSLARKGQKRSDEAKANMVAAWARRKGIN